MLLFCFHTWKFPLAHRILPLVIDALLVLFLHQQFFPFNSIDFSLFNDRTFIADTREFTESWILERLSALTIDFVSTTVADWRMFRCCKLRWDPFWHLYHCRVIWLSNIYWNNLITVGINSAPVIPLITARLTKRAESALALETTFMLHSSRSRTIGLVACQVNPVAVAIFSWA